MVNAMKDQYEAAMFANHHNLHNLMAIVDYNKIQSLDTTDNTLTLEPFKDKWQSFGWNVIEMDGHNLLDMKDALNKIPLSKASPTVFIANTVKGKGVSFMENQVLWHYRTALDSEFDDAMKELEL